MSTITKIVYYFYHHKPLTVKFFLSIAFLLIATFARAEQMSFDILLMNKKIGTTLITRLTENGGERYKLFSESTAKVMFVKQQSEIIFDVFFKGGHMLHSLYRMQKDDEQLETTVKKVASAYQVVIGQESRSFSAPVMISSVQLYFREPVGISKVFVERLGDFIALKKTAEGVYEYLLPDGIRNIYRYKNGMLYELEIKKGMGSVFMRPTAS